MRLSGHRSTFAPLPAPLPAPLLAVREPDATLAFWSRIGLWLAAALAGALFAAALLLWLRHGATVFFDTLSAGIGACM
ncbi:hypothetical protein [Xanthobacter agilis]|jgi:hypothetical protein|uniref:Uncharacterized protein n=1 Tax=Xanthobacter agilis TaxID=47492 RepID=A0ABU0LB14_XANAG|nr:hypothetical protein [Xanthobacter agilis]MDQ0504255.1 hypothetical protein [Xanthobacter agilis]